MRKITMPIIGLILAVSLLVSCSTVNVGFKKAAKATKISVEETYGVIYAAYINERTIDGQLLVDKETKDKAAAIYDRYVEVQSDLVTAVVNEDWDEHSRQIRLAQLLATELLELAVDLELFEGSE